MPAAAVIPAPVAYIKFVAVKKLVVGFMHEKYLVPFLAKLLYLEEIRAFQASICFEYISMV